MRRPDLNNLGRELLRHGVAGRHARRIVEELGAHFEDRVAEGIESGCSPAEAERRALEALGPMDVIAAAAIAEDSLKSWAWRWPKTARVFYPLACIAALPVVPVRAGIAHAPEIVRWSACIVLGALATAIMFLALQLSITLT